MISLTNISKVYGSGDAANTVLHRINLVIEEGEFVAIMGPSGSGKSTLLNILGTLDVPSSGTYTFLDTQIGSLSADQRALFRRYILGFIFQGYNLLKKKTSLENVEVPLIYQGIDSKERKRIATQALEDVGLADRLLYDPGQLSGGQQQRAALARALVLQPKVLLLDEPLSNLDAKLRVQMRLEIRRLQKRLKVTSVYVTHDQTEAMTLADRLVVMNGGHVEQFGTPQDIYDWPATMFVADFIGKANFFDGVVENGQVRIGKTVLSVGPHLDFINGAPVRVACRPEKPVLDTDDNEFGRFERGEAHDDDDLAAVDIVLGHGAAIALDEEGLILGDTGQGTTTPDPDQKVRDAA